MSDLVSSGRESLLAMFNPARNIRKGKAILEDLEDDSDISRGILRVIDRVIGSSYIALGAVEISAYTSAIAATAYSLYSIAQ